MTTRTYIRIGRLAAWAALCVAIAGAAWGGSLLFKWGPEGREGTIFVRLTVGTETIDIWPEDAHGFQSLPDGTISVPIEFRLQRCAPWWSPECGPPSGEGHIICGIAQ